MNQIAKMWTIPAHHVTTIAALVALRQLQFQRKIAHLLFRTLFPVTVLLQIPSKARQWKQWKNSNQEVMRQASLPLQNWQKLINKTIASTQVNKMATHVICLLPLPPFTPLKKQQF